MRHRKFNLVSLLSLPEHTENVLSEFIEQEKDVDGNVMMMMMNTCACPTYLFVVGLLCTRISYKFTEISFYMGSS